MDESLDHSFTIWTLDFRYTHGLVSDIGIGRDKGSGLHITSVVHIALQNVWDQWWPQANQGQSLKVAFFNAFS